MTNIDVKVTGAQLEQPEIDVYVARAREKFKGRTIREIDIKVDGEYVDLSYTFEPVKFDRIRRITGYLVGTTERFNNAKKAEVEDRVKHDLNSTMEQIWFKKRTNTVRCTVFVCFSVYL